MAKISNGAIAGIAAGAIALIALIAGAAWLKKQREKDKADAANAAAENAAKMAAYNAALRTNPTQAVLPSFQYNAPSNGGLDSSTRDTMLWLAGINGVGNILGGFFGGRNKNKSSSPALSDYDGPAPSYHDETGDYEYQFV